MSLITKSLASPAALAYFAAAAELYEGIRVDESIVRRYREDWHASQAYLDAAVAAHDAVKEAFLATLAELGGFAQRIEADAELDRRVVRTLMAAEANLGTRDDMEWRQILRALHERNQRRADELKALGADFE